MYLSSPVSHENKNCVGNDRKSSEMTARLMWTQYQYISFEAKLFTVSDYHVDIFRPRILMKIDCQNLRGQITVYLNESEPNFLTLGINDYKLYNKKWIRCVLWCFPKFWPKNWFDSAITLRWPEKHLAKKLWTLKMTSRMALKFAHIQFRKLTFWHFWFLQNR